MSTSRCPSCGAAVRPAAPWCLLCHRDLRPPPVPVLVAVPAAPAEPAEPEAAVPGKHAQGWPCAACGTNNVFESTACVTCGAGFLGGLGTAAGGGLRLPLVGDLSRLGRSARLWLATAVGLFGSLALSGLLILVGKMF